MWQENITMTAILNSLARILQVVLNAVIRIIESLFSGITNLIVRFVSSQFGVGVVVFAAGYLVFVNGKQDEGALLGLVGLLISGTSYRKKKKSKN